MIPTDIDGVEISIGDLSPFSFFCTISRGSVTEKYFGKHISFFL
jgi:hypothetical protein